MVYRFAQFELDIEERRLSLDGQSVVLRPKVFDALCLLVENHGRLLRKDELMRRLWPEQFVEDNNLDHTISQLRRVLRDGEKEKRFIETVPRQGYRFIYDVTKAVDDGQGSAERSEVEAAAFKQDIRFFDAKDGARIAYSIAGEGPVILKAANWLNHLEFELKSPIWQHWLPILTRHNTLIRYDERGNGLSSWNVQDFSFEAWLRDFEQLTQEVKVDRFTLLGISQGAAVAVWYAAKYPEKVERLVLCGSYARGWMRRPIPGEVERRNALMTLVRLGWGKDNPAFRQLFTTIYMPDGGPEHQQ